MHGPSVSFSWVGSYRQEVIAYLLVFNQVCTNLYRVMLKVQESLYSIINISQLLNFFKELSSHQNLLFISFQKWTFTTSRVNRVNNRNSLARMRLRLR